MQTFAKTMGVGDEEAKAWVSPLAGLNDAAFTDHLAWLAKRKAFMQEKVIAPTPKQPANALASTLAEVVDFMSEFLDAQNQEGRVATYTDSSLPVDDLDGLPEQIIEYFAAQGDDE